MSTPPHGVTPSTAVNSSDHGALVRVAAGFCTACMAFFLVTRLYIRWPWRTLFGSDDTVAVIASVLAVVQVIVTMVAVSLGLGRQADILSHSALDAVEKLVYAADLLFLLTIFLGKFAIALLFVRLASVRTQSRAASSMAIASGAFGAISILVIAVPQAGFSPWAYGSATAESMIARWIAVAVMSNLLELTFLAFPVFLLWSLRMKRSTKAMVILGMWTRLLLIPISILRVLSISRSLRSPSFTFAYASTEIITQVEMAYTLVAATIPCLRMFLQSAKTGLLAGETGMTVVLGTTTDHSYGILATKSKGSRASSKSRKWGRMSVRSYDTKMFESLDLSSLARGKSVTEAISGDQVPVASDGSRKAIMVRQTVDVQYDPSEPAPDIPRPPLLEKSSQSSDSGSAQKSDEHL